MPKAGQSRGALSLGVVLSLVLVLVGLAGIGYALVRIGAQPVAVDEAMRSLPSVPTTVVAEVPPTAEATAPVALYDSYPGKGDVVGSLSIPALKKKLPIIEGTDEDDLERGVGHLSQSVLPGEPDNCVLSGHRDTVFRTLGKLKVGDRFVTKTSAGTFTYEIIRIRIVGKDDTTTIAPTDHAVLTVSTCYPFRFVGAAPDRYVLTADLVAGE